MIYPKKIKIGDIFMGMYELINPSVANVYFGTNGTARNADATTLGSGAAAGIGATQTTGGMKRVLLGRLNDTSAGSIVVSGAGGAGSNVESASSAGTFAKQEAGNYSIQRVASNVAGVANTTLRGGAGQYAQPRRSIHELQNAFRSEAIATAIRNGYWVAFSGVWSTTPGVTNNSIADVAGNVGNSGEVDQAANPTRAIPGEWAYRHHSPTVQQVDYSAKRT